MLSITTKSKSMNNFKWALCVLSLGMYSSFFSQSLMPSQVTISKKKPIYIETSKGEQLDVTLKSAKVKKGLIKLLKVEKKDGAKMKLTASDIRLMYAAPIGIEKFVNKVDFLTDIEKWGDGKIKSDYLNQGYGYFEQSRVIIKKKERTLLLQLLNPSFCKVVKIYNDPFAKKSTGVGVGLVGVGRNSTSFYIKRITDESAYLIKKSKYKKTFEKLWESCDRVSNMYPKAKWKEIPSHIVTFTECK